MNLFGKNLNKEILYIAEIGVNHEGSMSRCIKLIKDAKSAGADVVKFQCFTPEKYHTTSEERYKRIKKFYFSEADFNKIIKYCKKIKINFLFTPISHDWVKYIKKYSSVIKVASGDLNFKFLIDKILKCNLKIILSTGISDLLEIKKSLNIIKKKYRKNFKDKLILMHCVSSYPVNDEDANLLSINYLKDKFNLTMGYSNHVKGINACLASIILGARVIEFHFTDNKKRKFRDHSLSLNKFDVKNLKIIGDNFNKLLGKYEKKINPNVKKDKKNFMKGIIANKNLKKGQRLSLDNLSYARPAKFFHANEINKVLNKKLKKNINLGQLVKKTILS